MTADNPFAEAAERCAQEPIQVPGSIQPHGFLLVLDETDLPVAEVAARVGMVDVAYFSRLFKKKYGLSPLRYRARPAEG